MVALTHHLVVRDDQSGATGCRYRKRFLQRCIDVVTLVAQVHGQHGVLPAQLTNRAVLGALAPGGTNTTTIPTTPATPAFKLLRDISLSGSPTRPAMRSPERRADRMAANAVDGLLQCVPQAAAVRFASG